LIDRASIVTIFIFPTNSLAEILGHLFLLHASAGSSNLHCTRPIWEREISLLKRKKHCAIFGRAFLSSLLASYPICFCLRWVGVSGPFPYVRHPKWLRFSVHRRDSECGLQTGDSDKCWIPFVTPPRISCLKSPVWWVDSCRDTVSSCRARSMTDSRIIVWRSPLSHVIKPLSSWHF
jgi:hypothetical protein